MSAAQVISLWRALAPRLKTSPPRFLLLLACAAAGEQGLCINAACDILGRGAGALCPIYKQLEKDGMLTVERVPKTDLLGRPIPGRPYIKLYATAAAVVALEVVS